MAQYGGRNVSAPPVDIDGASPSTSGYVPSVMGIREAVTVTPSTSAAAAAAGGEGESNSLADLSLSQIDPRVLAELPPSLQDEIRSHYQRPVAAVAAAAASCATATKAPSLGSPAKATGTKGGGPRKRGRPKKVVAPRNNGVKKKLSSVNVEHSVKLKKPQEEVGKNSGLPVVSEESRGSRDSRSCLPERTEPCLRASRPERPTFCGKTSVEEIRPLVKVKQYKDIMIVGRVLRYLDAY